MWRSRCGSLNGSGRRKRSSIRLKMEVFRPIPSARVITAITVNPGDLRSCRNAKRNSFMIAISLKVFLSFCSQGDDRIDTRGTACGNKTGDQRDSGQNQSHNDHRPQIGSADTEEKALKKPRGNKHA